MKEYRYKINGTKYKIAVGDIRDNIVQVEVNGTPYKVELDTEVATRAMSRAPQIKAAAPAPRTETGEKVVSTQVEENSRPGAVKSPLPGTVMGFTVSVGETVKVGDTVCVLEAMKMENDIHTQRAGVVKQILVNTGDAVLEGADLMIIE